MSSRQGPGGPPGNKKGQVAGPGPWVSGWNGLKDVTEAEQQLVVMLEGTVFRDHRGAQFAEDRAGRVVVVEQVESQLADQVDAALAQFPFLGAEAQAATYAGPACTFSRALPMKKDFQGSPLTGTPPPRVKI